MAKSPSRRQALYFPDDMLKELQREAKRLDRPISWLIQQAWRCARDEMRRIPSTADYMPDVSCQTQGYLVAQALHDRPPQDQAQP